MAKALVLGATGHIGVHITRALLAEGHAVRAAYRNEKYGFLLENFPVERVRVDLMTGEGLPQALDGVDWVFHAAGYYPRFTGKREEAIQTGIRTVRIFLKALYEARPWRVVFTSSAATIQRVSDRAVTEEDAEPWPLAGPRPLYAAVKIAMEQEVMRAAGEGLPIVVVNPTVCVGEYDAHAFSGQLVLAFAKRHVPFYIQYRFNAVYTGDVGIAHLRAAEKGRFAQRYLLACRNMSLKDFSGLAAVTAGVHPPGWRLPYPLVMAGACASEAVGWLIGREPILAREMVRNSRAGQIVDGSKAVRELGMPQTPIEEAVRKAVNWFRENGYLK